jgi:Phytanoyl-CoA dioxygenase (PhyH)
MIANTPLRAPSQAEIESFDRDGFVILPGVLSPSALAPLTDACARLIDDGNSLDITEETLRANLPNPDSLFGAPSYRETLSDRGHFRMRFNTARDDATVLNFALGGAIGAVVAALMHARCVRFIDDILFVKEPQTAEPTEWHDDDQGSVATGPQRCSVWVSLGDVPLSAGPIRYLRGSHRRYRKAHALANANPEDIVECPLMCGDIAVHDLDTIHAAGPNLGSGPRQSWALRYAGEKARFILRETRREPREWYALSDGLPLSGPRFPIAWPVGDAARLSEPEASL